MSYGLMGARVRNLAASSTRTFVLYADTDRGVLLTRDGGMSWRPGAGEPVPSFPSSALTDWQQGDGFALRIGDHGRLERRMASGESQPTMERWRIRMATSVFVTPGRVIAAGPGGAYWSTDGEAW